ncbi:MAG: PilZ domain-containing protein [Deltaproteobacteria bacterium]|jgi:hypothetical protein
MRKPTWEKCHYYFTRRCPEHETIDKAYLIPQLLEPSAIKAANDTCDRCEIYHQEKRKYRRIARPFRVVVSNKKPKRKIRGTVVDVSINGALIKLDNWIHFNKEEMVNLKLYYSKVSPDKKEINIAKVSGQIKRVAKEKQELAIVFIKDDGVKKCANI